MDIKKEAGIKIKKARIFKGFTQKQLADAVGSSQEYISKVETGNVNLTLDYITRIAEFLNVDVSLIIKSSDGKIF